jgi:putative membrane-bound dehydrogenase-like protein
VTAWRNGALICAAPDILFAADENGDGRADRVERLFTGFATDNYQARVNSLTLGLDGWFYGANGLLGGTIRGGKSGDVQLGKRDFRFRPDTREFEPAGGFTQHGRSRDDWGRWFGCENSLPLYHFPLAEHYVARNPRAAPPGSRVALGASAGPCFPIAEALPRYNHPESAGRFTAACGVGIYRDALLGPAFRGNAFTCEPAHNLVSRAILSDGPLPSARRAEDEAQSEFLASSDVWFRPVQVRTGPDGALYVVDMYRFLIEHPRWIPADRMAKIDARAGADLGRIYRIAPTGTKLAAVADLTSAKPAELARAFACANGTERDRIQLRLMELDARDDAVPVLAREARSSQVPEVRVHALSLLDVLGKLAADDVAAALGDAHPRVREHGVRLSERFPKVAAIQTKLRDLVTDPDLGVRMQLALTLGECEGDDAATALRKLAASDDAKNPWFRAAVMSSAAKHPLNLSSAAAAASKKSADDAGMKKIVAQLLAGASKSRSDVLRQFAPALALKGVAAAGGELFAQRCALCHRLNDAGHDVGPNLSALRDKPPDYWLKNILDPNAVVEPATAATMLELADGRVLAGVVKAETATSFTLASPGGVVETILRADVKSRKPAPLSLMPEGIESGLRPQDMADLIAFLRSAPAPTPAGASERQAR